MLEGLVLGLPVGGFLLGRKGLTYAIILRNDRNYDLYNKADVIYHLMVDYIDKSKLADYFMILMDFLIFTSNKFHFMLFPGIWK